MQEIWKDAVGYEEYFMISNFGNVWSKRTNKILTPSISKSGYCTIATKFNGQKGKYKTIKIHRMVAEAFVKNKNNKPYVNHIDGNKKNNYYKNLEWCTPKENAAHSYLIGLSNAVKGADNYASKLTLDEVNEIRNNFIDNKEKHEIIAKRYGVSRTTITNLLNNKIYKIIARK